MLKSWETPKILPEPLELPPILTNIAENGIWNVTLTLLSELKFKIRLGCLKSNSLFQVMVYVSSKLMDS